MDNNQPLATTVAALYTKFISMLTAFAVQFNVM
jgi:hypothetical protein